MALNERELHYKSQIKEHQADKEKSLLEIQALQSELTQLQEEKTITENELNQAINTLKQDLEKLQNELSERGKFLLFFCSFIKLPIFILERKEKMILRERESQYEQEIDEYQKNLEISIIQNQNIKSELENLQQEKESNENTLNDIINSLKKDFEKQIQILKTQNIESQEHRSYFFFFLFLTYFFPY